MTIRLENWLFGMGANSEYASPEQYFPRFCGKAYGHPDRDDGEVISTSAITGYDEETDEFICQSRRYTLGTVDEEYDKKFPGSKERLVESAKRLNQKLKGKEKNGNSN